MDANNAALHFNNGTTIHINPSTSSNPSAVVEIFEQNRPGSIIMEFGKIELDWFTRAVHHEIYEAEQERDGLTESEYKIYKKLKAKLKK